MGPPAVSGDVLPMELLPAPGDMFAAFHIKRTDGRLGCDPGELSLRSEVEANRKRSFAAWFQARGIRTKYVEQDPRFQEVMERSRAHWGLTHQDQPTLGGRDVQS